MLTTGPRRGAAAGPHSGRFVLRIPPELHGDLKAAAARAGVSLNSHCRSILTTAVRGGGNGGMITAALLAALTAEFDEALVGLVVFGSRIRNEHTATSDIDLLIAVSESVAVSRELYTRWDTAVDTVQADAGVVSPHFAHLPSEHAAVGSLWLEVALHGVVVLDPTGVVARTLARVRDRIAAGEVQRRVAYGHPYWIHVGRDA